MVIRHDEDDMRLLGLNGEGETEKKGEAAKYGTVHRAKLK